MKEAILYKKLPDQKVQCLNCAHYCQIPLAGRGICGVRENKEGKLYSLVYEKAAALQVDPIEKKPFFHFLPGSFCLSLATVGCSFNCLNCQNYNLSQGPKIMGRIAGQIISPGEIINLAQKHQVSSLSYTYTDPVVFSEYALAVMKLAKQAGLKNSWVSNGFLSEELAQLAIPYLDAINIDIKSFSDSFYKKICGARLEPVLAAAKLMKKAGIWLEITTLAIPTISDSKTMFKSIASFIKKELGAETPWHISRFSGDISWQLQHLPETQLQTLQMAYEIGKATGLKYVYAGNLPDFSLTSTFCPNCQAKCLERKNYLIERYDKEGRCQKCGQNLNLILK